MQFWNIYEQFVADGRDGSVTICNEAQFLNIPEQFVADGRDGSLASVNAIHELNILYASVTAPITECDKSAYLNARHIWNVPRIVVTNEAFHSGVISINLPHPLYK